ncbi:MAG TPA: lysylphosphatidylglycerol synthase transmembrane domain-containing protein [Longimicrobiales bacterium]
MTKGRRGRLLDWKAALGILISAAALYYVFKDQDLGALLHEVRSANPFYLFWATFAATFVFWIRAWRWKALLDPVREGTSFNSRFAATTIGFMGNNVFPARVGEFMRVIALAKAEKIPIVTSATSIVLERMFDAFTVIALLFLSMVLPGLPDTAVGAGYAWKAVLLGAAITALLVVLCVLVIWPRTAVYVAEQMVRPLPARARRPIIDALEAFLLGASALRNPRVVMRAGLWSIVLWLVNAAGFWIAFHAFDLPLSFTAALFFQGALVVGVAAPSAPGFFGVYEFFASLVLVGMWGADPTKTNAFAASYHLAGFIPVTLIGLYYAWRLRITLADAAESEEEVEDAVEEVTGQKP